MSNARYIVGDTREVLRTLPGASVDLVLTSPPFLALRSYLPADHPDKDREMGSEPNPGAFLDALLDVVVELRRVLAPHGSLCVELGDTYSGSGGAGGDYGPGGLRDGQERFNGSAAKARAHAQKDRTRNPQPGWPLAKSLCLVPSTFAFALAYGRNPWTGRELEPWRVRNLIAWCRPNPPVGALGDKFRPATSYMTVACPGPKRYFDLDAVREPHQSDPTKMGGNGGAPGNPNPKGSTTPTPGNPAGAPPLDYWVIPTHPYPGSHYATWPPDLCVRPVKAMCPAFVCESCGIALGLSHDAPRTTLPGVRRGDNQSLAHEDHAVLLQGLRESAHGAQPQEHAGMGAGPEGLHPHPSAGASNGEPRGLRHGAPASDGREVGPDAGTPRSGAPHQRGEGRQPSGEPAGDGQEPARRRAEVVAQDGVPALWRAGSSSEPCPACGGHLRRGRVLDPFAGSGTTLAVATGHGRDAIGIDLDPRNADLARERIGLFLEVA